MDRAKQAARLRKNGHTYQEIAAELGYQSRNGAFHAVQSVKPSRHNFAKGRARELVLTDYSNQDDCYKCHCDRYYVDYDGDKRCWSCGTLLVVPVMVSRVMKAS